MAYEHLYFIKSDDDAATTDVIDAPAIAKDDAFNALLLYLLESLLERLYKLDKLELLLRLYVFELDE
ncbi:hypothetical protein M992_2305 [Moellerella wisconsensis ATCC 35017]|uniref:Uncharacterized protein n=1 Tax=Moellerella wisconsensis ATCC 35017 TaxID=1354267 RepID=A0A0N0I9M2_9GAMM|nr:hypothetical protein M992_2305 [Moellerella wisconsensis ATCC 35017]